MIAILCFQNSLYISDIKDTELEKKKPQFFGGDK